MVTPSTTYTELMAISLAGSLSTIASVAGLVNNKHKKIVN